MKPYVICHMVASVDGRILSSRWRPMGAGTGLFERLHEQLGGNGLACRSRDRSGIHELRGLPRSHEPDLSEETLVRSARCRRRRCRARRARRDSLGALGYRRRPNRRRADGAGPRRPPRLDGVSYIFAGEQDLDLGPALEILNRELGVKRLLVEGGGGANGALLRAGLIDEISLVICPAVDGVSSVFDSGDEDAGTPAPVRSMTLETSHALEGGAVWLRYRLESG